MKTIYKSTSLKVFFAVLSSLIIIFSTSLNTISASKKTNSSATLYKTQADFENSNAYLNFSDFSSTVDFDKSIIIPGMLCTNVSGSSCTTMCPQGMCLAKHYILVTAYDTKKKCKSVIYVLSKYTKKLLTTIILPTKAHVGGIAYDGTNIWVSNDANRVSCFKYNKLYKAVKSPYYKVSFKATHKLKLDDSSSFMTYYNKHLWIGSYLKNNNSKKTTHLYSFSIGKKSGTPTLKKQFSLKIPNRVQGVCFLDKNTLVLSRSQCINPTSGNDYMSQLTFYDLSWKNKGKSVKGTNNGTFLLPPLNEGVYAYKGYLYVLFESCTYAYRSGDPHECQNPVDRICAFPIQELKKKYIE